MTCEAEAKTGEGMADNILECLQKTRLVSDMVRFQTMILLQQFPENATRNMPN